jgi:putative transposase
MKKKYIIKLKKEEEKKIKQILRSGVYSASVRNRVQILSLSNKGFSDKDICNIVEVRRTCVSSVKKRYCVGGFNNAVYDAPRSGRPAKFDIKDEAELVALACSEPPEGSAKWTLSLLKANMRKPIGKSTVHLLLKKTNASLGKKKCGVSEK